MFLLRCWLRAATWALACTSANPAHVNGVGVSSLLNITLNLHRFTHVWIQHRRICIWRDVQLVSLAGTVCNREVGATAAETAFSNRGVCGLTRHSGLPARLWCILASCAGRGWLLLTGHLRTRRGALATTAAVRRAPGLLCHGKDQCSQNECGCYCQYSLH